WAQKYSFPLAEYHSNDLAQVAQYLAIVRNPYFPHRELIKTIRQELGARATAFPDELRQDFPGKSLDEIVNQVPVDALLLAVIRAHKKANPGWFDPYVELARLPCPVYLTTSPTSLLEKALRVAGKEPHVGYFHWKDDLKLPQTDLREELPASDLSDDEQLD